MDRLAVEAFNILALEPGDPSGIRILIVEDEMVTALTLVDIASALDASSEISTRAAQARALVAAKRFDAAIVDVNLAGEPADGVMDLLCTRQIPFIITTGYSSLAIPEKYRSLTMLAKPYTPDQITMALLRILPPCQTR